ncbi:MAG TPA: site-specific integrase [Micromonosporaceae bacterium]|nr:site-specific integrase [Micromonosporaceae bacterium]HCU49520.1 site-specific integrase [Micromonosporaceae bacterium]
MAGIFVDSKSGMFGFRMDVGRAADGSRRQVKRGGFSTAQEALGERRRLQQAKDAGTQKARLAGSVRSLCDGWLASRVQELEPNTVYGYGWLFQLTYPYIGCLRASTLTGRIAGRMYDVLERQGLSRITLRTLDLVLTKAFGEETGRTLNAPTPRPSDVEHPMWTLPEVRRFLDGTRGERRHLLWRLLAVTGLRRGEACGLKWLDLNLDTGTLSVRRQRVVQDRPAAVVEKPPKSHNGFRTIALDIVTLALLRTAEDAACSPYVFTGRTGLPLRPDNVTGQFNKTAARLGLPPIGPHQLRHLLASSLLEAGYGIHESAKPSTTFVATGTTERAGPPL